MKLISSRKWIIENNEISGSIKEWLIKNQAIEKETNAPYEIWRMNYYDATITLYNTSKDNKMTLYITDSNYEEILELHNYIDSIAGNRFVPPSKEFLIGFDEAGKGEVLGHEVLVGVLLPREIFNDLERDCGIADTKTKHAIRYWDDIFNKIDFYRSKGLEFFIEKIPPWHFDKYNINQLMDLTYQRILNYSTQKINLEKCRIVIDDYGVGFRLKKFLNFLANRGAEIIVINHADDKYLESRIASLIAKREQQKVLKTIAYNPEFKLEGKELGSGNPGDKKTIEWLTEWWHIHKYWPWFVKKSFKTITQIEGKKNTNKQAVPPLNEKLLSRNFIEKFNNGKLDIRSLSIICPHCGHIAKSIKLIPKNKLTTAVCVFCGKEIPNVAITLRYYCGRCLPDTSVIANGFLSKDLENIKFFENFTILLHPIVKKESDHPRGKKELERLGYYNSIGRIRLEEVSSLIKYSERENESILRDEIIQEATLQQNAILITADNGMKGSAQAKGLFVLEI